MKQRCPVGGERNHLEGPLFARVALAAQEIERHGQPVVDLHLVDDGDVELVEDQRLRDMGGEFRVALDDRHRARTPALVGRRKLGCTAERKCRDQVDREGGRVIVIDDDRDIRLGLPHPFLRLHESGKHPLPIRFLRAAIVEGGTDGGNVRRSNTCDDLGHDSLPFG
jgi:hypothetical protein